MLVDIQRRLGQASHTQAWSVETVSKLHYCLTYSSVVSRDSVRIALLIAALNDLDIMACDSENAYLNAPCGEKIWFVAGPEFGLKQGQVVNVVWALYGLKSIQRILWHHKRRIVVTPKNVSAADYDTEKAITASINYLETKRNVIQAHHVKGHTFSRVGNCVT